MLPAINTANTSARKAPIRANPLKMRYFGIFSRHLTSGFSSTVQVFPIILVFRGFCGLFGLILCFLRRSSLLSGAETDFSLGGAKMDLFFETIGIAGVVILGVVGGGMFSRLRRPYWAVGYLISITLIGLLLAARWSTALSFAAPFSWLSGGRMRYIVLALGITMGLVTPLSRLPRRVEKWAVGALTGFFVVSFSVVPFLWPTWVRGELSKLETRIGSDGVCLQTRAYTCGPAAAVTGLRRLGFKAQEGEIAVLAGTNSITGTLPRSLDSALRGRYGREGLECRYQCFDSVAELKGLGVTLAIVKDAFLIDHCVAVLEVSEGTVLVGDPVLGEQVISHEQFEKMWRFTGIVLHRASQARI